MKVDLIITPEAYDDLAEAAKWYDQQRTGLGEELIGSIHACIQSTLRMPTVHEIVVLDYRRALVRRFPYAVYYEIVGSTMTVYGIFHTSRDPEIWRLRLAK